MELVVRKAESDEWIVAKEMERISETVNETVEQVRRLEERTKQIGGIANVISGISEQTNLLALNAAIEAADAEGWRPAAPAVDDAQWAPVHQALLAHGAASRSASPLPVSLRFRRGSQRRSRLSPLRRRAC